MRQNVKKSSFWLLVVILTSYFVVGFPDGAFTVSWLGISEDIAGMTTAHTGFILVAYSVTYTIAGIILPQLSKRLKLQSVYILGLIVMGLGFVSLALAGNFSLVLVAIAVYGLGTGGMASSMNAYMAKHFTASQNNLMHFFWGAGAAFSPMLMGKAMAIFTWRAGYFILTGVLVLVLVILLISVSKKMWLTEDESPVDGPIKNQTTDTFAVTAPPKTKHLTKKWHQFVEILTFFFLGGTDYTLVFFTGAALVARGDHTNESVAIFPAVYYIFMTVGRLIFGILAKWLKELQIIRIGIVIALGGVVILYFTGNIAGMALTGFGLAPLLPTLVSDTSNRFTPKILSKIVGYELAAFGAGIAVLFFMTSQLMHFISYEALFPLGVTFILLVFVCNEILDKALKKCQNNKPGG